MIYRYNNQEQPSCILPLTRVLYVSNLAHIYTKTTTSRQVVNMQFKANK